MMLRRAYGWIGGRGKRKVGMILFNRRSKDLAAGTGCHSKDATEIKRAGSFPKYPWPSGA